MAEILRVIWNGSEVGAISDPVPDMWYLEGKWTSNGTSASKEFEQQANASDPKSLVDLVHALRVILTPPDESYKTFCLATYLGEGLLAVRRLVSEEAIKQYFPGFVQD